LFCEKSIGDSPYGGDLAYRIVFWQEVISMAKPENLGEKVQRYGYAKKKKIKLYGKELEVVSDPVHRQGDDVFVEGGRVRETSASSSECCRNGKSHKV